MNGLQYIHMLCNELDGLKVEMLTEKPILILCDNTDAVIIANTNRDVKSMRHCKRHLFHMRQLRQDREVTYKYINNRR